MLLLTNTYAKYWETGGLLWTTFNDHLPYIANTMTEKTEITQFFNQE